jgi:hypothetical protein
MWALTLASLLLLLTQISLITAPRESQAQGFPGAYVVVPDVPEAGDAATPVQGDLTRPQPSLPDQASNAISVGPPRLVVERESINLGEVKLNKVVRVAFTLKNAGGQPLQINELPYIEVVEGCCPPDPVVGARTLQPGQTTELALEFMMHEGMGGPHLFRVHVKTNDPDRPDRSLDVRSNWVP